MANRTPTPARVHREEVRPRPQKTVDERLAVLDEKLGWILDAMKRDAAQIEAGVARLDARVAVVEDENEQLRSLLAVFGGVLVERARNAAAQQEAGQ